MVVVVILLPWRPDPAISPCRFLPHDDRGKFSSRNTIRKTTLSAKHRYLNIALSVSLFLLAFTSNAAAQSAKEQLQSTIDHVIEILLTIQSPKDIERNRKSLHQVLLSRFDFAAMAQRSLGNRWNDLNGKEEEFVSVFTDFVEHS